MAELCLRKFPPDSLSFTYGLKGLYIEDEDVGFLMKPNFNGFFKLGDKKNSLIINSDGLRGNSVSSFSNAEKKIVFLGDSFTLGAPLDNDYFVAKLSHSLKPHNYEILNLGHNHSGPLQHFNRYKKIIEGNGIKPDLVVLVLYSGNDFSDFSTSISVTEEGCLTAQKKYTGVKKFLMKTVPYLSQTLYARMNSFYAKELYCEQIFKEEYYENDFVVNTFNKLREIHQYFNEENILFTVIHIPAVSQIHPYSYVDLNYIKLNNIKLDLPSRIIGKFTSDFSMPFLDLYPRLFEECNKTGKRLYHEAHIDNHFDKSGHSVVSREILEYLIKSELIKL